MRREVSLVDMIFRLTRAAALALFLAGASGAVLAQKIQITSPSDGVMVHSGQTLTVKVDADSTAFRYVDVGTALNIQSPPPLYGPPYEFKIQIPPDASSGLCAVGATGTPKSGGTVVWDQITVDVEREDSPQKLIPALSVVYFSYVGDAVPTIVTGVFADGSRVLLNHSTYIAYSSDTPTVAKIDEQGIVTALAPGKAMIAITYRNISIQVPVYVPAPVTVTPSTASLYPLETSKFSATLSMDPELDQSVIWSVRPSIGSIDQTGTYTAPSSVSVRESVTVTATSAADRTKSASAQVWIRARPRSK